MKPKFRAPSGPRTPDYAPAARRILFLSLLLLFLLLTMGNLQKSREALADRIAPSILRFHILANSDSREDQAVKLEVRSFLLDYIQDRLPEHVDSKPSSPGFPKTNATWKQPPPGFSQKNRCPTPRACLWSKPGFPPGSMTTLSSPAAPTTPPGSSLEKETATTGGASSTRGSAFSMKSAKRFPKKAAGNFRIN